MIELRGVSPAEATIEKLRELAHGICLDLGTGTGLSSLTMAHLPQVTHVVTIENNPLYYSQLQAFNLTQVYHPHTEGDILLGVDLAQFDFVFIDHLPLDTRASVASRCLDAGLTVLVDDAIVVDLDPRLSRAENYAWSN